MLDRIRAILVKEFIQIFRDPRMSRVIFVAPLIQLIVFGYAATTDVRHVATAVVDRDETPASRALVARLDGSGYFDIVQRVDSDTAARAALDNGWRGPTTLRWPFRTSVPFR